MAQQPLSWLAGIGMALLVLAATLVLLPLDLIVAALSLVLAVCGRPQLGLNLAITRDLSCNASLGGHPYEVMSRRFARAADAKVWPFHFICNNLGAFQKSHCAICEKAGNDGREIVHVSANFSLPELTDPTRKTG